MPTFEIVVRTTNRDYPLVTKYKVDASNSTDAQTEAKAQFMEEYEVYNDKIVTYVVHNEAYQQERLHYLKNHGLPDIIPS